MNYNFEFWIYKQSPEDKYTFDRMCTYKEFQEALEHELKTTYYSSEYSYYDLLDYISSEKYGLDFNKNIPQARCIYCWPVVGSSEGHYFHIECYTNDGKVAKLFLLKTLTGNTEMALAINTVINRWLLKYQ